MTELNIDFKFDSADESITDDVVYNSSSCFDISQITDLLLDDISQQIFIIDSASKYIVYMNSAFGDLFNVDTSYVGQCHKLICGLDKPCPSCKLNQNINDDFFIHNHEKCVLKRNLVLKCRNIEISGRLYTVNYVIDNAHNHVITQSNSDKDNETIAYFTKIYADNVTAPDLQIYHFIETMCHFFKAKFCLLYEFDSNNSDFSHGNNLICSQSFVDLKSQIDDDKEISTNIDQNLKNQIYEDKSVRFFEDKSLGRLFTIPLEGHGKFMGFLIFLEPDEKILNKSLNNFKTVLKLLASAIEHRDMHSKLTRIESVDTLTNLKNRKIMLHDLKTIALYDNVGVFYLNVNELNIINSNFGIQKGDEILIKTASLLNQFFNKSKYIYRVGADEFVAIVPNVEESDFVMLSDMLKAYMRSEKGFSVSVGTNWNKSGAVIQRILNLAESDMYVEKKNYYRSHHGDEKIAKRYRKFNDNILSIIEPDKIKKLIQNDCFKVYYQPKFRISGNKAQISGAEALIRLIVDGKVIPPNDFIPALESAHYTYLIDYYVFEKICKRMRERLNAKQTVLPVSCNFSRHTIVRTDFKDTLNRILTKYQIDCKLVPLEVSEHTNTEKHKQLVEVTNYLADEGFNISIDDFGTAHANIYSLADLSVNEIKFDKKLIDNLNLEDNSKITTILSMLISMCKRLGIKTIAEGVEDETQSQILRNLGCDEIQGFYYSKPIEDNDYYSRF